MKRLLILLTVLCLSLLSCPALCSGEESYLCTDSDALEMDDFSIVLPKGTRYELTEKVYEDVFLTVYPDSATGGVRENFQVSWYGHPLTGDVQSVDAQLGDGFRNDGSLAGPDFHGIVLHPARLREVLRELHLGH